jgi:hypothetical protein
VTSWSRHPDRHEDKKQPVQDQPSSVVASMIYAGVYLNDVTPSLERIVHLHIMVIRA